MILSGTTVVDPDKPYVTAPSGDQPQPDRLARQLLGPPDRGSVPLPPRELFGSERSQRAEKSSVSEGSWTPDDWAVAAVSALVAIPLCEAGWHAVVNEPEHFARGITAIGIGLPLGIAGFSFHRWKAGIPAHARKLIGDAALKWWPASALLALLYFAGPVAYQRATAPISVQPQTGFTQQQVDEKIATAVTNLNSQLAESNRQRDTARREADALRQKVQNVPPPPPAPEDQVPVDWQSDFQLNWYAGPKIAWIRFLGISTALARVKDAYVISSFTGHKEPLDVANPTNLAERWKIDQVEPIPLGATVIFVYEPKPSPSLPDFMSQWGAFEFHVVYDNKEYVKMYSQDYINSKMAREMPGIFGPRVTPKNDK